MEFVMLEMNVRRRFAALSFLGLAVFPFSASAQQVNVYTTREPTLLNPVLEAFTKDTGIKVNSVFLKDGLEERVKAEGAASPADVMIMVDAARLISAATAGITQPIVSATVARIVPADLRDPAGQWVALTERSRVVYASKDRVAQNAITYEDLADPKWKGRICIRSGQNDYNNALFGAVVARAGEVGAETWLKGVKANLARKPAGGDRDVAKDIQAGLCDIGVANTYYLGLMLNREPERKAWADAVKVLQTTFAGGGTHVNISGAAIAKNAPNKADAIKLIEYMLGEKAQALYANGNYEYPVNAAVPGSETVKLFGPIKADTVSLEAIAKSRKAAANLVDKVGFDN
jgi:iron(III) transport system substrate-binding protein